MKDFNSYANDGSKNDRMPHDNGNSFGGVDVSALLSALAGKYEGASEDEIISAIISEAQKGRKNGTLTDADLENFERTVMPMLNEKQRAKLGKIIRYLKSK